MRIILKLISEKKNENNYNPIFVYTINGIDTHHLGSFFQLLSSSAATILLVHLFMHKESKVGEWANLYSFLLFSLLDNRNDPNDHISHIQSTDKYTYQSNYVGDYIRNMSSSSSSSTHVHSINFLNMHLDRNWFTPI